MQNMIYCPVCGTKTDYRKACPVCGYEMVRDYEMFPTLGVIPGGLVSVPAKRQAREKQLLQKAVYELMQPMRNELLKQREMIKKAVQAAFQAMQEAEKAKLEAKQQYAILEKKLRQMACSPASSRQPLIRIVNNTCTFGSYPQDSDGTVRPILWQVLEVDQANHRALLLSDKILDCRPYYTSLADMNWEKAGKDSRGIRYWLNTVFFQKAFPSDAEKSLILITNVEAHPNPSPRYQTDQGNAVQDKIFLLSAQEVIRYFGSNSDVSGEYVILGGEKADAQGSDYTKKNTKLFQASGGRSPWWLRSMGSSATIGSGAIAVMDNRGSAVLSWIGRTVYSGGIGVRPALWVDLQPE